METGVPRGRIRTSLEMSPFRRRMHPWLTARPIEDGSFVPWMPTTPPQRHDRITFEYAESP